MKTQLFKTIVFPVRTGWLAGRATQKPPQRVAWVTGLESGKTARDESLPAKVWPGVNRMIKECPIRNISIREREINGRPHLFADRECTGADFDADLTRRAADPETQRWWQKADAGPSPLSDAAANGKIRSDTKEVYFRP